MKHFRTRVVLAAASVMTLMTFAACGSSPTAPPPSSQLRITCPPAVEGQSLDGQPVAVAFGAPLTSGGTAPVNLACTPVSGSLFSGGTTRVTCTASDARGVTAACTTSVFVRLPARLIGTKFLAFGDSITAGRYSDPVRSIIVDGGITYTTILEARLKSQYTQQASSIVIVNEGLPSDTAIAAAPVGGGRFSDAMQRHRPEILLLMMGTNDILEPDGVNRGIQALQRMITLAKSSGFNARVVLATVPPQRAGVPPIRPVPHLVPVINDRIRQLAIQENVPLADVYNAMKDDLFLIGQDNLHPTPAGMDVIAKVFFDTIKANLEAPQPAAQGIQ